MGVGDNFTRLAIFNKQNGQSGNKLLSGQVVARTTKKEPGGTVHPKDEGEVHPVASLRFRSFHSHVDIVNTYFAKKMYT